MKYSVLSQSKYRFGPSKAIAFPVKTTVPYTNSVPSNANLNHPNGRDPRSGSQTRSIASSFSTTVVSGVMPTRRAAGPLRLPHPPGCDRPCEPRCHRRWQRRHAAQGSARDPAPRARWRRGRAGTLPTRIVVVVGRGHGVITLEDLERNLEVTYPTAAPATYTRNVATIASLFTWATVRGSV